MRVMRGREVVELDDDLRRFASGYRAVAVDVGTGDGRFAYTVARSNPDVFVVGVDPDADQLGEYASRAVKKPARGGAPNALFVVATAEDLPVELDGMADRVTVNYPWGALLRAVVLGERDVLDNLARIARPDASLEMMINLRIFAEPMSREVQGLPEVTEGYVDEQLAAIYARSGLRIVGRGVMSGDETKAVPSTWARRMAHGRHPETFAIRAVANPTAEGSAATS